MDQHCKLVFKFTLFLLLFTTDSFANCPLRCKCKQNEIRCANKSLSSIPNLETLEIVPIVIDVSGNNIDFIANYDFSFDKTESVEKLYLNASKIVDIEYTAFMEMTNLTEVNLSDNLLQHLPNDLFKYNEQLAILDLSFNNFASIPLLISTSLRYLNLINSGLNKMGNKSLIKLPNLEYVYLQRNHIKVIEIEALQHLHLKSIDLSFNPWTCNCKTINLLNFLNNKKVLVLDENIQCKAHHGNYIEIFNKVGPTNQTKHFCTSNVYNFNTKMVTSPPVFDNDVTFLSKFSDFLQHSTAYKLILLFLIILTSFLCGYFFASYKLHQEFLDQDSSSCNTLLNKELV